MMKKKTKAGRRILAALLSFCMALPCTIQTSAVTDLSADDYEDIVSQYAVASDSIAYEQYKQMYEANYPQQIIQINAADYVRYETSDGAIAPEIYQDYQDMEGSSVLTT